MRILMFNNPAAGHFLPLLPLARALRRKGHVVAFCTAATMGDAVGAQGFELLAAGPTIEEAIGEAARRVGAEAMAGQTPEFAAEFFAGARVDLAVDDAVAAARAWAPDLIVAEHCDFVGPVVAAVLKVPSAIAAIDPALEPELLDALAAVARPRYLERGLQAPDHAPSGRRLLDLCPPSLQRQGGPPALERLPMRPEPHQGPADAPRAPRTAGTGRPRVLVGFSTAPGARSVLGPVLRALSALDVDLVATSGGAEHDGFGLVPGRVELVTFVPAAELLDGVSVVVHHGGSGTTFGTAARGIPAVVLPGTPGQRRQAHRLQAAGAGLALPMDDRTPEDVVAAVGRLLTEPEFTNAAHRLRDEIAEMPPPAHVAEQLVALLA